MMLSCCFRNTNNNNKKTKKQEEVKSSLLQQYDSEPQRPRQSSSRRSSNEMGNIKTVHSATLKCPQEKHPPSRIEKRLLKQRSQDSLPSRDLVPVSPPVSSPTHPQYSVQHKFRKTSSNNQLRERPQSQSLPSPPATPKLEIGKKRYSTGVLQSSSVCAESSLASKASFNCPVVRSRETLIEYKKVPVEQPSTESNHQNTEEAVSIQGSQLVQPVTNLCNQINNNNEDLLKVKEKEILEKEREIQSLREKYELMIQKLKNDNKSALDQAKEFYTSQFNQELIKQKKESEEIVLQVNNNANEAITKLNLEIATEKSKLAAEHQAVVASLTYDLKEKEEKIDKAFIEVEQREQAWQEEKDDILGEIQRLKAEASKMVAILAAEYEEENLSEEKKRSLSAEVYSLQLVVEMRTGEVKTLRSKLGAMTHQLETAAATQTKLDKAQARVEDLEEQLKQKVEQEQRMSAEKYQLESSMTQSTKQMERMSMNVEELQWRIRNNFELPVDIYSKPAPASGTGHLQNVDKIPDNNVPCSKIIDGHQVSNKFVIPVCHQGGQQKIEADADENDESDVIDETVGDAANDISPSSDICMDYDSIENRQEQDEKGDGNNNIPTVEEEEDENVDHDSLDEGLGDISSDGEVAESPELKNPVHDNFNNITSDEDKSSANFNATDEVSEKERRPSRISFETPL